MTGHEHWDEQAAGYALDALEPDELAEFDGHLAGCDECRQLVDQHALVAAQLGALADDDRPAPTWADLRDGIIGPANEPASNVALPTRGRVVPIRQHRRAALLTAAAAAAAAIVGITVWQTGGGSSHGPLTSASSCANTAGCHIVALHSGGNTALSVLVYRHDVALVSTTMSQPPPGSEWALWRLPKSGAPQLVTTFDTVDGTRAPIDVPYADIAGFAVSRERAGTTPNTPSTVVASGTVA